MKDFMQWQDSAAQEAIIETIKSTMDLCSQIRRDSEKKKSVSHEKLESLQYSWKTIYNIVSKNSREQNVLDSIIKPEDNKNKKLPSIDDYITSPVKF